MDPLQVWCQSVLFTYYGKDTKEESTEKKTYCIATEEKNLASNIAGQMMQQDTVRTTFESNSTVYSRLDGEVEAFTVMPAVLKKIPLYCRWVKQNVAMQRETFEKINTICPGKGLFF